MNDDNFEYRIAIPRIGAFDNKWKADRHRKARVHYLNWFSDMVSWLFACDPQFEIGSIEDGRNDLVLVFKFKTREAAEAFGARMLEADPRRAA